MSRWKKEDAGDKALYMGIIYLSTAFHKRGGSFQEPPQSSQLRAAFNRSRRLPSRGGSGHVATSGACAFPQLGHCQPEPTVPRNPFGGSASNWRWRSSPNSRTPRFWSSVSSSRPARTPYLCCATHIRGLLGGRGVAKFNVNLAAKWELLPCLAVHGSKINLSRWRPSEELLVLWTSINHDVELDLADFLTAIKVRLIASHLEFCSYVHDFLQRIGQRVTSSRSRLKSVYAKCLKKQAAVLKYIIPLYIRDWSTTEKGKEYRRRHAEYAKEWRARNREKFLETQRRCYHKARFEALQRYSSKAPKCACCGESELAFLCLDHVNGDGAEHRRKIGMAQGTAAQVHNQGQKVNVGGNGLPYWLKKNNWPEGFQVLCYNCNSAKRVDGICPHQKNKLTLVV